MRKRLSESQLMEKARQLRISLVDMLYRAGSGHPGGSLSAIDILNVLYNNVMKHDPLDLNMPDRDHFFLSKSHCTPALYTVLADCGYFDAAELKTLRKFGSILQGHPAADKTPGIEVSAGSLGQGLSIAVGVAIASKLDNKSNRVYCMIGDGECQEGEIWEAAMSAGFYKLDNLCGILDANRLQIDGLVENVMDINPIKEKWLAFNWNVLEIDGHNITEIEEAFAKAEQHKGKPTMIIAHTIKGKGVSYMENVASWHGVTPNKEQYEQALAELNSMEVK